MRLIPAIWLLFALAGIFSCASDHPSPQVLNISEDTLHFSGNGGIWRITVNSNCDWQITSNESWCTTDTAAGSKTADILVLVDTNHTETERTARLTFSCDQQYAEINVYQDSYSYSTYHYELPVIFHLFYADAADSLQNAPQEVFQQLIDQCNLLYSAKINSVNMNLQLVAATEDPDGSPLAEPGIDRILKTPASTMSCESFMNENNAEYASFLWNLNKYINVFVYTFTEENTSGISHLPYTPRENSLPGLEISNYYFSNQPKYVHCISINNQYLMEDDAYITLAHELGHYLGLHHVFSENSCDETDYCDDTPNYNRSAYMEQLEEIADKDVTVPFSLVAKRNDCNGGVFFSTNIMDYYYSYQDRFTPDQYSRVRHVLENSPLIPGPKNIATVKAVADDIVPKIRAVK